MKPTPARLFLILFALALPLPAQDKANAPAPAPASAPTQPAKVGVIDFVRALEKYKRFQDERKLIDEEGQRLTTSLEAFEGKLKVLKADRDLQPLNSLEWEKKNLILEKELLEFQGLKKMYSEEMKRKYDAIVVKGYEDVAKAVDKVARDRGLSLVLRVHEDTGAGSTGEKLQVYQRRIIWFAAAEVDITTDVGILLEAGLIGNDKPAPAEASDKK